MMMNSFALLLVLIAATTSAKGENLRALQNSPPSSGFCNWGPDGTAATSTCSGGAQGDDWWCNESSENCGQCGGRWCPGGVDDIDTARSGEVSSPSSSFTKEIIQGRCYSKPPYNNPANCPNVVGSFMNVLESQLDSNIQTTSFQPYVDSADFSSPPDKALFWLSFLGTYTEHDSDKWTQFLRHQVSIPPSLITPEQTPGGFLLHDLVFCGQPENNCSIENSNAYWKFWNAAYGEFAKSVSGHVQIVIEPLADVSFLIRSAIANLDANAVTSVTLYSRDCLSTQKLQTALEQRNIAEISCSTDLIDFVLCQDSSSLPCTQYHATYDPADNSNHDDTTTSSSNQVAGSKAADGTEMPTLPLALSQDDDEHEDNAAKDDTNKVNGNQSDGTSTTTIQQVHHYHHRNPALSTFFVFVAVLLVGSIYFAYSRRVVVIGYEIIDDNNRQNEDKPENLLFRNNNG